MTTRHIRKFLLPSLDANDVIGSRRSFVASADVVRNDFPLVAFQDSATCCYIGDKEDPRECRPISQGDFLQLLTTTKHVLARRRYIVEESKDLLLYIEEFEGSLEKTVLVTAHFESIEKATAFKLGKPWSAAAEVTNNPAFDLATMRSDPHQAASARSRISYEMFKLYAGVG